MELRRRVILFGAIFLAILIALYASLSPVVVVKHVDFRHEQQREGTYMGFRIMTERDKVLAGLPLEGYIAEVTKGRLFAVEGDAWKAVAENASAAAEKKSLGKDWRQRLPSDKYPTGVLFFKPEEAPVNQLASLFTGSRDPAYLYLGMPERPLYLKAEYRAFSNDDFHLGGGLSSYPTPPTDFLFPGRKWSPWVAAAGLALCILLPWPKSGDCAAVLLGYAQSLAATEEPGRAREIYGKILALDPPAESWLLDIVKDDLSALDKPEKDKR